MPCSFPLSTRSAIFWRRLSGLTWYGSSVMTKQRCGCWILFDLDDRPHGDEAAPGAIGVLDAAIADDEGTRSGSPAPGRARAAPRAVLRVPPRGGRVPTARPLATSRRLWGGMLVAIPTAMPAEPLTSRFGKRLGKMVGSAVRPS